MEPIISLKYYNLQGYLNAIFRITVVQQLSKIQLSYLTRCAVSLRSLRFLLEIPTEISDLPVASRFAQTFRYFCPVRRWFGPVLLPITSCQVKTSRCMTVPRRHIVPQSSARRSVRLRWTLDDAALSPAVGQQAPAANHCRSSDVTTSAGVVL